LAELKKWQRFSGFNSSVVAAPPPEVCKLFLDPLPTRTKDRTFLALGVAFGKTHWEWWNFDGSDTPPELF
jgi:hypothetical protein